MDVVVWLRSLGLGNYEAAFRENEIDETVLPSLTAEDLKELGIAALGHRRKLLDAIAALRTDTSAPGPSNDLKTTPSAPSPSLADRAEPHAKPGLGARVVYWDKYQILSEDGQRLLCRGWRLGDDGTRESVLIVLPAAEHPSRLSLDRLTHEYELKDDLDGAWAVRPLELVRDRGRTMLMLESPEGEPLDRLIGPPMEIGRFLRLAVALSAAFGRLHERGLVHKDIKPTNILVNSATGQV